MRAPDDLTCAVCGETAEAALLLSECLDCGRWFHLNPYSNQPGTDCGDASIGSSDGIETYCNDCIDAAERRRVAALGSDRARAESMARTVMGGSVPLPPSSGADPTEPAPDGRRTFRRVDDE